MSKINLICTIIILTCSVTSAQVSNLIPINTATHTAIQNGSWFDSSTWDVGTVPDDASIVVIPENVSVQYQGCSDAHIFAIRVDGDFTCIPDQSSGKSCLTFDTFIGTHTSIVRFLASNPNMEIDVSISPFDIEAHKSGVSGYTQIWNEVAKSHFSDGAPVEEVVRNVIGDRRYNTYEEAISGDTEVVELSRSQYDDGVGVTGRYLWDNMQHSLGLVVMGEIEIIGAEKLVMSKLGANAFEGENSILIEDVPNGWKDGDTILITRDGNISSQEKGEDVRVIESINGSSIAIDKNLDYDHTGRTSDNLHCYVSNLTRNITFKSSDKSQIHRRGHLMAMHNSENIQIRNAAFIDMGRTDKSRLIDDFVWQKWIEPKVFKSKISPLGQEICQMQMNPFEEITNIRGRYSIHLHKTGATHLDNMVYVTGNVIWGNPGWGITHHDSYATVSQNVVYDVTGAGIVSESGSELGFWDDNLIVDIKKGHTMDPYDAAVFHDEYLYSGQGLGMKGRGVMCRNNVIVKSEQGVGVINFNPSITNHDRVDPIALSLFRPDYEIDQFPLSTNGYSIEGDGVMPVEIALIMENTTVIDANRALRSIERDMGLNHESRSVFDGFYAWGVKHGLSINYQADYSFKDVFISGNGSNNTIGLYMWKHSHNQTFENIKLTDLESGIQVSKLVESENGNLKTRNNGVTPWVFVNLELDNVDELYRIEKDDESTTVDYSEHSDNCIILDSEDISTRPLTFTIIDSSELEVDYDSEDFKFEVDGIVTDDFGSYEMGVEQPPAQGTLRLAYPSRIYEFASKDKFEEYIIENGVFQDEETDEYYFIINEFLPNRRTFDYHSFPIRVTIKNPPQTGVFINPSIEPEENFAPQLQLISRIASASQSSKNENLFYDNQPLDVHAYKAIDGNNNGRINCQIYQQGLVPLGSFSQTQEELEPWFDLDLKELKWIEYIDIWNTVELNGVDAEIPSDHFGDFYILISESPFGSMGLDEARASANYEYYIPNDGEIKRKISLNDMQAKGRYIRIQAVGMNVIKLAEIEVIGKTTSDVDTTTKEEVEEAQIFPNPSTGHLKIQMPIAFDAKVISVYDMMGRLIYMEEGSIPALYEMNLDVHSGTYAIHVEGEDNRAIVKRIVIIK